MTNAPAFTHHCGFHSSVADEQRPEQRQRQDKVILVDIVLPRMSAIAISPMLSRNWYSLIFGPSTRYRRARSSDTRSRSPAAPGAAPALHIGVIAGLAVKSSRAIPPPNARKAVLCRVALVTSR